MQILNFFSYQRTKRKTSTGKGIGIMVHCSSLLICVRIFETSSQFASVVGLGLWVPVTLRVFTHPGKTSLYNYMRKRMNKLKI